MTLAVARAGDQLRPVPFPVQCGSLKKTEKAPGLETDLLPKIAAGEASAVQEFITRYQRLIWWLTRRQGTADPEDAVQDIFIDIWKSASRFDASKSSEVSFVTMIARRRLIDRKRKAQRTPLSEEIENVVSDKLQVSSDPIEHAAEARMAQRSLNALQPDQRRVLELSIYQGFSHGEISAATGIPLGTVKSHIRRGLIQVREMMTRHQGGKGSQEEATQ